MNNAVIEIIEPNENEEDAAPITVARAVYEHPLPVRLCHWLNTVSLFILIGSGLQIFRAFPSFGPKIPQKDLIDWPRSLAIGGWLGGALQWHLTFMWVYLATGVVYLGYQYSAATSARFCSPPRYPRRVAHGEALFFFRREARQHEAYNSLQKQAYTSASSG